MGFYAEIHCILRHNLFHGAAELEPIHGKTTPPEVPRSCESILKKSAAKRNFLRLRDPWKTQRGWRVADKKNMRYIYIYNIIYTHVQIITVDYIHI